MAPYLENAEHFGEKLHHAAGIAEHDGRGLVEKAFLRVFFALLGVIAGIHWVLGENGFAYCCGS